MPVKLVRKERQLIILFLSAYDNNAFQDCSKVWPENTEDRGIDALATSQTGRTLAIEHTLIQPFVGEKEDSHRFLNAFQCIERDESLLLADHRIQVGIRVGALRAEYDWNKIGEEVRTCLRERIPSLPEGVSELECAVGGGSSKGSFQMTLKLIVSRTRGMAATILVRYDVPDNLGEVIEKALRTKLPKLVRAPADKHILLLEFDQPILSDLLIYSEISKRQEHFPVLKQVNEIWFVETGNERLACFSLIDHRGLHEVLTFENGVLKMRQDYRPYLEDLT